MIKENKNYIYFILFISLFIYCSLFVISAGNWQMPTFLHVYIWPVSQHLPYPSEDIVLNATFHDRYPWLTIYPAFILKDKRSNKRINFWAAFKFYKSFAIECRNSDRLRIWSVPSMKIEGELQTFRLFRFALIKDLPTAQ